MTNSLITTTYLSTTCEAKVSTPVVLIHGWGFNSAVWESSIKQLQQFTDVITIDLPGFGANINNTLTEYSIENIAKAVQLSVGKPAVYIGWSLGGLVATQLACQYPEQVKGCVTVASSPCFLNKKEETSTWRGILPSVLQSFYQQLAQDTQKTLDGFLKIQAMGSPNIRQDIKTIKNLVMKYPVPTEKTLSDSLKLLETVDLRNQLSNLNLPFLRIYGKLDSLVPKAVISNIDMLLPHSQKHVFDKASHAPFISHADEFNELLLKWLTQYIK